MVTIKFLLQHKHQQLYMVLESERCQHQLSSTLSGGHTMGRSDWKWLVWSRVSFPL